MENLPLLVLRKIFDELITNLNDAIRYSLVCKNWRTAYEIIYKPKTLCLCPNEFLRLNHSLLFSDEKLTKFNCFRIPKETLPFLSSEITRVHFENIKKLVIFKFRWVYLTKFEFHDFSFRDHINHFRHLEYLEIQYPIANLKDSEIDLPNLKTLYLNKCEFNERETEIVLNTPSLEHLVLYESTTGYSKILPSLSKFKFLFPSKLKYLRSTIGIEETNFKLDTKFENLECLFLQYHYNDLHWDDPKYNFLPGSHQVLVNDFLESFQNLKLLFSRLLPIDYVNLDKQKLKLNLNELKCLPSFKADLDNANWQKYVKHRQYLRQLPYEFNLDFNQIVDCKIPLYHFKENYFVVKLLEVGEVADQSALVEFLKSARIDHLGLKQEFNLGQDFFDQIANFLTVDSIELFASTLNRLTDLSVLTRLNFSHFTLLNSKRRPREAILTVLRKPTCYTFVVNSSEDVRYPPSCYIIKRIDDLFCTTHEFASEKGLKFSEDIIHSTFDHIKNPLALSRNILDEFVNSIDFFA